MYSWLWLDTDVSDKTEEMGLHYLELVKGLLAKKHSQPDSQQECRETLQNLREAATTLLKSLDLANVNKTKTAPLVLAISLASRE